MRREAGGFLRRPRTPTVWIALAAVAVVVVAIVVFALARGDGHRDARRSSLPTIARGAYAGDVGDVTAPAALRAVLDRPSVDAAARTSATVDGGSLRGENAARALRCARTVSSNRSDPVVLLATATYHGAGAVVAGVHHGTRTVAFVLAARDCAVLVSQSR